MSNISYKRGFTIVELLIVIVVIGILAAITIVAFTGIQTRAYNTSVISNAKNTINLVDSYVAANGQYPSTAAELCATVDNVCISNINAPVTTNNSSFISALRTMGAPMQSAPVGDANGRSGIVYYVFSGGTYKGEAKPVYIYYVLKGAGTNCGLPNTATDARSVLAATASSTGYSWTSSAGMTGCYIHINGPVI